MLRAARGPGIRGEVFGREESKTLAPGLAVGGKSLTGRILTPKSGEGAGCTRFRLFPLAYRSVVCCAGQIQENWGIEDPELRKFEISIFVFHFFVLV